MMMSVTFRVEQCGREREEMGGGGRGVRFRTSSGVKRRSSIAKPLNYFGAGRVLHLEPLHSSSSAHAFLHQSPCNKPGLANPRSHGDQTDASKLSDY